MIVLSNERGGQGGYGAVEPGLQGGIVQACGRTAGAAAVRLLYLNIKASACQRCAGFRMARVGRADDGSAVVTRNSRAAVRALNPALPSPASRRRVGSVSEAA
jgi:hypothetical protein